MAGVHDVKWTGVTCHVETLSHGQPGHPVKGASFLSWAQAMVNSRASKLTPVTVRGRDLPSSR